MLSVAFSCTRGILSAHPFTHSSSQLSSLEWSRRVNEAVGFVNFQAQL